MKLVDRLMENTLVYRLWQAPFAEDKFDPIRRHTDLQQVRRVLDVGCGPGTNARHFAHCDYTGIDLNPAYIDSARRRFGRNFLVGDATRFTPSDGLFDCVLVNSFLHHVDTGSVRNVLTQLAKVVAPGGSIHVVELVLPEKASLPRLLARWDRGKFARSQQEWRILFEHDYQTEVFEPFPLRGLGAELWKLVYFKGRPRQ